MTVAKQIEGRLRRFRRTVVSELQRRFKAGESYRELSAKVGISPRSLSDYVNELREISLKDLHTLEEKLGICEIPYPTDPDPDAQKKARRDIPKFIVNQPNVWPLEEER